MVEERTYLSAAANKEDLSILDEVQQLFLRLGDLVGDIHTTSLQPLDHDLGDLVGDQNLDVKKKRGEEMENNRKQFKINE